MSAAWHERIVKSLKANDVRLVTYIPDNVLSPLLKAVHADPYFTVICPAREEAACRIGRGRDPLSAAHQKMNRFDLTCRLVKKLKDEAVIGGIGNTNFDLWAAGQRPQNFYMLGSMGLAVPIGLGVALAQPERRTFVLEG